MAQSGMNFPLTTTLCVLILSLITLCSASDNNSSSKSRDYKTFPLCYGGQPGTNGLPGTHGMPGSPGTPGHDGRDGAKGDLGSREKTGPQGPPGAEGKKGSKGEHGNQGPTGQKGERGDKGNRETPQLSSHINWKECACKKADGKD